MEGPHYSRSSLDGPMVARKTLCGVRLVVQPGELVAVVGEVGAGKSSLLAALLGELMPVKGPDGAVHGRSFGCCHVVAMLLPILQSPERCRHGRLSERNHASSN